MALTGLDRREVTPPVKFLHNAHINQNIHQSVHTMHHDEGYLALSVHQDVISMLVQFTSW
jgi:hypothetical protein